MTAARTVVTSRAPRAGVGKVQSFGGDRRARSAHNDRLQARRLPASDIATLRWVFDLLEGSMGIGSNFGASITKIQEGRSFQPDIEGFVGECCEIEPDAVCTLADLQSVSRAWCAEAAVKRPSPTALAKWLTERGVTRAKVRGRTELRGLRLKPWAKGAPLPPHSERMEPQRMHVRNEHGETRVDRCARVEVWACWEMGGRPQYSRQLGRERRPDDYLAPIVRVPQDPRRLGTQVYDARAALLEIPLAYAVTLYRMYGQDTPRSMHCFPGCKGGAQHSGICENRYPWIGDLAPLAEDTPLVIAHAAKLTREARIASGHAFTSKLSATPRAALSDLCEIRFEPTMPDETKLQTEARLRRAKLERERKREASEAVAREAHTMLVNASAAYREART